MSSLTNVNSTLPNELVDMIMCYMSSNTNTIFKNNEFVKYALNQINEIITYEDGTEYLYENDCSFAQSYFRVISGNDEDYFIKSNINNYAMMDEDYVTTKNEYNRNH